jgi:hypothetical protein
VSEIVTVTRRLAGKLTLRVIAEAVAPKGPYNDTTATAFAVTK